MAQSLEKRHQTGLTVEAPVTEQIVRDFLFSNETKLTEAQQNLFLNIATAMNLNPFKREIYVVKYGDNCSIITGYQVYIKRAAQTGMLDGWKAENTFDEKGTCTGATVTIHRKDQQFPFEWHVDMADFNTNRAEWKSKPNWMIKKVAIGQAFRLAFPEEVGPLPYTDEEATVIPTRDVTPGDPRASTAERAKAAISAAKPEKEAAGPVPLATPEDLDRIFITAEECGVTEKQVGEYCKTFLDVQSRKNIRADQVKGIIAWLKGELPPSE